MVSREEAEEFALSLPETTVDGHTMSVAGKQFAWSYPERVHPKKARVPRRDVLVIPVHDLDEKQALLDSAPDKFFTTDHYNGYSAVLVRLAAIDADELTDLLTEAWRIKAPRQLVKEGGKNERGIRQARP